VTVADPDAVAAARRAGLRYVSDATPGITRTRRGERWTYRTPDGREIDDAEELQRLHHLAIPPAWSDVWICPIANGHLQATGRDGRGRKQYRYHQEWRSLRDAAKYEHMVTFGHALPRIRSRVAEHLQLDGLPREKVLATVVRLLDSTAIRVGNEEYARENRSYGLTTLRDKHVRVDGSRVRFEFRGKAGKLHAVSVQDRRLARIVRQCQELPGHELFQYVDDDGERRSVSSEDVNAYLRDISGEDITAKDFRTWVGTVLAACFLRELGAPASEREGRRQVTEAIARVAGQLGNTPGIARTCYVHPDVIEAHLDGSLVQLRMRPASSDSSPPIARLRDEERAVLRLLERRQAPQQAAAGG
jgi:DNA topoisomerase-1